MLQKGSGKVGKPAFGFKAFWTVISTARQCVLAPFLLFFSSGSARKRPDSVPVFQDVSPVGDAIQRFAQARIGDHPSTRTADSW